MTTKRLTALNIFRIQYASNLYITQYEKPLFPLLIRPAAKHLALVGNIGSPTSQYYHSFFRWATTQWDTIVYVPGDMEHNTTSNIDNLLKQYTNLFVLDRQNQFYVYDPFKLALWTPIDQKSTRKLYIFTYGCDGRKTFLEHHGTIQSYGLNGENKNKKVYTNSRGKDETPEKGFKTDAILSFPIKNFQ